MITLAAGASDTAAAARIRTEVVRWIATTPATLEHFRANMPKFQDWLAFIDGEPVGVGACFLVPGAEGAGTATGTNCVLPKARRRGVGTAIYRRVSAYARTLNKVQLEVPGFDDDAEGVAFARSHGFEVAARVRGLRLVLDDCPRPSIDVPEGIVITSLAEQPQLARGVWETACEAMPDMPYGGDAPLSAGSFEAFVALRLDGPKFIPDATFVAVKKGEVIGYGQLGWEDRAAGIGYHEMLAVRRSGRGQGIATTLKAVQIAWALDHGLSELRTGNEERNGAARAVNAKFPYVPLPDQLLYRGPLAPES